MNIAAEDHSGLCFMIDIYIGIVYILLSNWKYDSDVMSIL